MKKEMTRANGFSNTSAWTREREIRENVSVRELGGRRRLVILRGISQNFLENSWWLLWRPLWHGLLTCHSDVVSMTWSLTWHI